MGRKLVITEEQYRRVLKEGVAINNKTQVMASGNSSNDIEDARRNAEENGLAKDKFDVVAPLEKNNQQPQLSTTDKENANIVVSESNFITKGQLQKSRLKVLKENSDLYTVKDFMRKISSKR